LSGITICTAKLTDDFAEMAKTDEKTHMTVDLTTAKIDEEELMARDRDRRSREDNRSQLWKW
jgi:hypothetical protein